MQTNHHPCTPKHVLKQSKHPNFVSRWTLWVLFSLFVHFTTEDIPRSPYWPKQVFRQQRHQGHETAFTTACFISFDLLDIQRSPPPKQVFRQQRHQGFLQNVYFFELVGWGFQDIKTSRLLLQHVSFLLICWRTSQHLCIVLHLYWAFQISWPK